MTLPDPTEEIADALGGAGWTGRVFYPPELPPLTAWERIKVEARIAWWRLRRRMLSQSGISSMVAVALLVSWAITGHLFLLIASATSFGIAFGQIWERWAS